MHERGMLQSLLIRVKKAGEAKQASGVRVAVNGDIDEAVRVGDVDALQEAIECSLFQVVPVATKIPFCPHIEVWCDESSV